MSGNLTPVPGSPFAIGQFGNSSIVIDQPGRFVYVTNNEQKLVGYRIEPFTGRLTPIHGLTPTNVAALAVDPLGRYAYAVQTQDNVFPLLIFTYRIDPETGQLCPLPVAPIPLPSNMSTIAVDPLGRFVYAPDSGNGDTISAFSINPANGTLTPIEGSPFTVGYSPQSISFDSLDRFAYVAGGPGASTYALSINPATGALTPLRPASYLTSTTGAQVVDPRGQFFYAAGLYGLNGYSILQSTTGLNSEAGELNTIAGSPFGLTAGPGVFPVSVAVDYTGTFVYAGYYLGGVLGFKINPASGALTQISPSPLLTAGSEPVIALATPRAHPVYQATQVPEPPLGPYKTFIASAINNSGEVTGQATLIGDEPLGEAFLYNGTTTSGFFFPGSHITAGSALNDKGEIVGTWTGVPIGNFLLLTKSFLFRSQGVSFNLDPRTGGESAATGINNAEHITGSISTGVCTSMFGLGCESPAGLGDTHAFLDLGLGPTDIGTLGGNFSQGMGLNEHDEVVGGSNVTSSGPNHVFVYSHGSFHDVGMFHGYSSVGTAINDRGEIIGTANGPSGQVGFVYRNGWFEHLNGLFGGKSSLPSGINLEGDVVGTSSVASGGPNHAFLYRHGKLVDLNSLTSPSLTLLTGAAGINDKGQIVANGLNGAVYVLTPICDFPF